MAMVADEIDYMAQPWKVRATSALGDESPSLSSYTPSAVLSALSQLSNNCTNGYPLANSPLLASSEQVKSCLDRLLAATRRLEQTSSESDLGQSSPKHCQGTTTSDWDPAAPPALSKECLVTPPPQPAAQEAIESAALMDLQERLRRLRSPEFPTAGRATGDPSGRTGDPSGRAASDKIKTWERTVLAAALHLDKEGLRRALTIMDQVLHNTRQIKALDGIIACSYAAGGEFVEMPHVAAAKESKKNLGREQQSLYRQLQVLAGEQPQHPREEGLFQEGWHHLQEGRRSQMEEDWRCRTEEWHHQQEAHEQWQDHPEVYEQWRQPINADSIQKAQVRSFPRQDCTPAGHKREPAAPKEAPGARQRPEDAEHPRDTQPVKPTLSDIIRMLSDEDPDRIFIARRVNKLGRQREVALRDHFSKYGAVLNVLIAHSTVSGQQTWQRPSGLGFVQMASEESVKQVLSLGREQEVCGEPICVMPFEKRASRGMREACEFGDSSTSSPWSNQSQPHQ